MTNNNIAAHRRSRAMPNSQGGLSVGPLRIAASTSV